VQGGAGGAVRQRTVNVAPSGRCHHEAV